MSKLWTLCHGQFCVVKQVTTLVQEASYVAVWMTSSEIRWDSMLQSVIHTLIHSQLVGSMPPQCQAPCSVAAVIPTCRRMAGGGDSGAGWEATVLRYDSRKASLQYAYYWNRLWGLQECFKTVNSAHTFSTEKRLTSSQHPQLGTLPGKAGEDSIVPVISLLHRRTTKQKRPFQLRFHRLPCRASSWLQDVRAGPRVPGFVFVSLSRDLWKTYYATFIVPGKQGGKDILLRGWRGCSSVRQTDSRAYYSRISCFS